MTAVFIIIGGAVGGVVGYLMDRAAAKKRGQAGQANTCEVQSEVRT